MPFLVLTVVSFFTTPPKEKTLDSVFDRLHTPVSSNENEDRKQLRKYEESPKIYDHEKVLSNSNWEFMKPDKASVLGFLTFVGVTFAILDFEFFVSHLSFP